MPQLVDQLKTGLDAPICLTWELTYGCNLACIHCLSSSGRRDPRELTTEECKAVIDELARLQVFYVNIGGGEPTIRPDFFEIVEYAVAKGVGVKFSTNGSQIDAAAAARLSGSDYIDIQISLDGADADTNDAVRGPGSYAMARRAMDNLAAAGFGPFKISVVITRQNVDQLDAFEALAASYGAELRLTRLRPSGRGADTWDQLHPTNAEQRQLYNWLVTRPHILTGDSFFHLSALGPALPGLNLCGAGRIVCLIDPVGDVYACPFVLHDEFKAGSVRDTGGFTHVWRGSTLFQSLREPQSPGACGSCGSFDACQGGCMAAKFFTGLPLDGPDPECVFGNADEALAAVPAKPAAGPGHSKPTPVARAAAGARVSEPDAGADALARRLRRSQAYLRMWALPLGDAGALAPLDVPETDIRGAEDIAARLLAHTLVGLKGQGLTQAETFAFADSYDVWSAVTVEEHEFLLDPQPARHDLVQAAWRFEGAWVLLWALGQVRHLVFPDRVADPAATVEGTITAVASRPAGDRPARRPVGEILDAADIARRLAVVAGEARAAGLPPPSGMDYGVVHERASAFAWLVGETD